MDRLGRFDVDLTPKSYLRAASQRLETATFLLEAASGRNLDAIYLAGYTLECGLKALILARTPENKRKDVYAELSSSAKWHQFDRLAAMLKRQGCIVPSPCSAALTRMAAIWSTNLRYVGTLVELKTASQFLDDVRIVHDWVQRSV